MNEKKELPGTTIEIQDNKITFIPEKTTYPWWRNALDRKKEGFLFPEILQDMDRIAFNLTKEGPAGKRMSKYDAYAINLSANPKSSQGKQKSEYKKIIISQLEKGRSALEKFKGREILVYIAVYIRKERYDTNDVDNFVKTIIDALKPYVGDDSKVVVIIAEKKLIGDYPIEDLDFLEQVLLVVTVPEAKIDLLK